MTRVQPGATASPGAIDPQRVLPALREDLALHPGPSLKTGVPSWMVEDPLRGRFYRIGWLEFELLSRWTAGGDASELAARVARETLLAPTLDEVLAVRQFLLTHELVIDSQRVQAAAQGKTVRQGLATRVLHHYLMFRIPLFNPDRFLVAALPWVWPLIGSRAFAVSVLAGLLGLALAMLQWDSYVSTFVDTLSLEGLASYALALVFAKVIHEFGHAFTARRFGLRVPRMGVAFVLLFPMLYTDTGETWRLMRQRDRFAIAAAGMRIEIILAAWCTLAWSFLPDGPLRSACFFLATTSWLITLAINASPFLRFDGYYMMSDATGIPNLHDEAAKALRHRLRRTLLGIDGPPPTIEGEPAPGWLFAFGAATAIYRFFLFLGIALAVYHFFFKLLGIFLFLVEIWWFILRPVWREMLEWWRHRARIRVRHALRFGALLLLLGLALVVPWQDRIFAEGWVRAGQEYAIHSPRPAVLVYRPAAGAVDSQDLVAVLESPELRLREARASARMGSLSSRLSAGAAAQADGAGKIGTSPGDPLAESARSTRAQLAQQQVEVRGADVEAVQLQLRAPFRGTVVDVAYDSMGGAMVARQELLARVVDTSHWIAEVFVSEDDVRRLKVGAPFKAWLQGVAPERLTGVVESIDTVPVEQLPAEMLAARFGGRLATTDDLNVLKPRRSLYRVRCSIEGAPGMHQARLASFVIDGERTSIADSLWRGTMTALMLQAGF
jgi:putative peptide zinc metalloprotease protein